MITLDVAFIHIEFFDELLLMFLKIYIKHLYFVKTALFYSKKEYKCVMCNTNMEA